jgi:hypothetical protein
MNHRRPTSLIFAFALGLAIFLAGFSDAGAALDLAYTLNAVDPANGIAEITANVKNIETAFFEIEEQPGWKISNNLQSFSVQALNGSTLSFTTYNYDPPGFVNANTRVWKIQCNSFLEVNIRYRMQVGFREVDEVGSPQQWGYLGPEFGMMTGAFRTESKKRYRNISKGCWNTSHLFSTVPWGITF